MVNDVIYETKKDNENRFGCEQSQCSPPSPPSPSLLDSAIRGYSFNCYFHRNTYKKLDKKEATTVTIIINISSEMNLNLLFHS